MPDVVGSGEADSESLVAIPAHVVEAAIRGLESGADAILDRDWACYAPGEREEAERYANETCLSVAGALQRALDRSKLQD